MKVECIRTSVRVLWRDERQGRAELQTPEQVQLLLAHYGLIEPAVNLPLHMENTDFIFEIRSSGFPCTALITRKPQGPVQTAAWHFAEEHLARILTQDGELGVLFLDENKFVPFSRLGYNEQRGFYFL